MPLSQQNLLSAETSPYLLQHKDNPVHWRPWSRAALEEARALNKPILLSVGYAACHWCHVMAHESFEDAAVAEVMNRLFVNIKVDREERPEIDQIYMAALTATGEQGGWPLTMFLDPDGRPFWGGTYFPRHQRYGRPGFVAVLEAVRKAWDEKTDELTRSAEALTAHVETRLSPQSSTGADPAASLRRLAGAVYELTDPSMGGLRGAPKFPSHPFMQVLWLDWLQNGETAHRDAVIFGTRRMLSGGIYDHVGGGLARYATDDQWLVPHFEKMLYDNAQLIHIACQIYAETGDPLFRERIAETVAWLLRDMRVEGGAFAASLDADSEGEEGLFYLWERSQIEAVLGGDAAVFFETFALAQPAGWEGAPILNRLERPDHRGDDTEAALRAMLDRLHAARAERIPPARDDKVLVDWNGLVIAAIARAARQFDRDDWLEAAQKAYRFVCESMVDGRLPHSVRGAQALFPGIAGDYAAMIDAAIALYQATGDDSLRRQALQWLAVLREHHGDAAGTGFFLSAADSDDVPMRIRGDIDDAMPSATAQIVEAMARLASLEGDAELQAHADAVAEAALGRAASQPHGQAGIVHAAAIAAQPRKLVMVERESAPVFVPVANRYPDPRRVDIVLDNNVASPVLPGGATADTTRPGAYLCLGQTCLPPLRTADALARHLRPPTATGPRQP